MGRTTMPTLDEEFEYLRTIQEIFKGREITVRALDMGADKELPYFGLLHEDNPQLGCRGIRVLLMQRELFKKQVRSIARVSRFGPVRLLLPFIALPEDVDAAREVIDDACRQEGVSRAELPVGMMVEIPSAAVAMEHFVEGMDFFSIGTNDLLQYSFAAGRENNDLEQYKKLMHPIMLKIVHGVVQCAQQYHRSVSLCGEIQSVYNAGLMAGLGLPSLSLAPKMIKPVREYLSKQYMRDFSVAARRAINCRKRREVEMIVSEMTKI
jgi:phosphotransferase system enzyme I (PtsI)